MKRNPFDDYVWWFGESPAPAWAERLAQWTVEIGSPHAGYGNVAQRGTRSANDGACERPCARQGALKPDPTTRSARIGDVFQLGPRRLFAAIRPIPRFLLDYWKAMPCGLALTDELHRLHRRKRHLPVASRICDSVQGNDVRGVPRVQRRLFTAEVRDSNPSAPPRRNTQGRLLGKNSCHSDRERCVCSERMPGQTDQFLAGMI
jgi:hypothetical protein